MMRALLVGASLDSNGHSANIPDLSTHDEAVYMSNRDTDA